MRLFPSAMIQVFVIGSALASSGAYAQVNQGQLIRLADYVMRCTDVPIPRTATDSQYFALLVTGVIAIDDSLGRGASTGTPFILNAVNQTIAKVDASGTSIQEDQVLTTICAVVSSETGEPAQGQVRRVVRTGDVVFAANCPIEEADKCGEMLHKMLIDKLNASLSTTALSKNVPSLFWRSVGSKEEAKDVDKLKGIIIASDEREVSTAPEIKVSGDLQTAAALTKPIDQQGMRPLITKRLSWIDVIKQPDEQWIISAISVSPEIAAALTPGS